MTREDRRRRQYLGALGAVLAGGLAGCSSGGNGDSNGESTSAGTESNNSREPSSTGTGSNGDKEQTEDQTTTFPPRTVGPPPDLGEPSDATGEVVTNDLSAGFEVVRHTPHIDGERFVVILAVRNIGDQRAELGEHDFSAELFDADGTSLGPTSSTGHMPGEHRPEDAVEMQLSTRNVDPEAVARYEITMTCSGIDAGVYCP